MTFPHESHLWQVTMEQQWSLCDLCSSPHASLSPFNVSRFGRDSRIFGVHVAVPRQHKQKRSFNTDGHTVSINTLMSQIHLICRIYGNSALVCMCVLFMYLLVFCIPVFGEHLHMCLFLFSCSVMSHILHNYFNRAEASFSVFLFLCQFWICCRPSKNGWELSSCPVCTGHPH